MRYLALLKDSFREAVDTMVFYVMIILSAIVVVLVACIGFTPEPVSSLSQRFTIRPLNVDPQDLKKFPLGLPDEMLPLDPGPYALVAVEPDNGAADRPNSPFLFHIRSKYQTSDEAKKVKQAPEQTIDFIKNRFASVGDSKFLQVTAVTLKDSRDPVHLDFDVHTLPTRATLRVWPHVPDLFFGALPLRFFKQPLGVLIWQIEDQLVGGLGSWLAVLVSVILTAFFIPNMLRKGTIDLLLVKPLHRTTLLIYKYLGGLLFIFLNTSVAVGGVWLVLGLRSGIWAPGFLLIILIITFFFAILYAVSALFSVLTGSPIVSIIMTCLVWVILYAAGRAYLLPDEIRQFEEITKVPKEDRHSDGRWVDVVKAIHFVLPRAKDLDYLASQLLLKDLLGSGDIQRVETKNAAFSWPESVSVDAIFIFLILGLACFRFATRDY